MSASRIMAGAISVVLVTAAWAQGAPGRAKQIDQAEAAPAPASELLYAPLNSCRLALTSASTAGLFAPKSTRTFRIRGTADLSTQGGSKTGCQVPTGATAISVSASVLKSSAAGFLSVNDAGGSGRTRILSWRANVVETATATLPMAAPGTEPALSLTSSGGAAVDLSLDVVGYYIPPIHAVVRSDGDISSGTTRVLSVKNVGTGMYDVKVDRNIALCAIFTRSVSETVASYSYVQRSDVVTVQTYYIDNRAQTDAGFVIKITC